MPIHNDSWGRKAADILKANYKDYEIEYNPLSMDGVIEVRKEGKLKMFFVDWQKIKNAEEYDLYLKRTHESFTGEVEDGAVHFRMRVPKEILK